MSTSSERLGSVLWPHPPPYLPTELHSLSGSFDSFLTSLAPCIGLLLGALSRAIQALQSTCCPDSYYGFRNMPRCLPVPTDSSEIAMVRLAEDGTGRQWQGTHTTEFFWT